MKISAVTKTPQEPGLPAPIIVLLIFFLKKVSFRTKKIRKMTIFVSRPLQTCRRM